MSYEEVAESFTSRMGTTLESQGLPRIAGQIFALLLLSDEPLTLEEIAQNLQISHGSASANTRLLESINLIERFTPRGERRVRHRVLEDLFPQMIEGSIGRLGRLAAVVHEARTQLPPAQKAARKRLKRVEETFDRCVASLRQILDQRQASRIHSSSTK